MPKHTKSERSKNAPGMRQSAVIVVNPMPAKKTSVARKGKRGK